MDLANGHVAALKKMFKTEFLGVKIYNLGTGQGASVLEMIKIFDRNFFFENWNLIHRDNSFVE